MFTSTPAAPTQPPKLLDRVRHMCRLLHYSIRTEDAYHDWIKRYILFHHKRHPIDMGAAEINQFLTHLAVEGHVSASTQNQAFSALLFLYKSVLQVDPGLIAGVVRAERSRSLPVVLTRPEARQVLAKLDGTYQLMGQLMYGSGLRLLECLRLPPSGRRLRAWRSDGSRRQGAQGPKNDVAGIRSTRFDGAYRTCAALA